MRSLILLFALLCSAVTVHAQQSDSLPSEPAYKGEIRRGADGQLFVVQAEASSSKASEVSRKPATMIVGEDAQVTTLTEAAKRARDGEVIEIQPGDYRGQPVVWTQNNLVIRGADQRPVMIADGKSAEGKAIWVVRGNNVLIENIEFRGARVASFNGAGIRLERGNLVVRRCAFFDNEMGILTANTPDITLDVSDSEFGSAPHHDGDLHHLLYVGAIGRFSLSGSRFQNGYQGHLVKSRARENYISYNFLVDGAEGNASYELEFPNGGLAFVVGNIIGQSAGTRNPVMIAYGAEGQRWSENALYLAHNTLSNDVPNGGTFLRVWSDKFSSEVEAWIINNLTVGVGGLHPPHYGRFEGNHSARRNELLYFAGQPLRPNHQSPLRGSVRMPGQAQGKDLLPSAEFTFPAGSRKLNGSSSLVPGALQ